LLWTFQRNDDVQLCELHVRPGVWRRIDVLERGFAQFDVAPQFHAVAVERDRVLV
jgi:hypothetical protein